MNILITGATGNIGREVIRYFDYASDNKIFAAVQNVRDNPFTEPVKLRVFDFYRTTTASEALAEIDVVFLLRPPHIANVEQVFKPLIEIFKSVSIKHVVFLSVQGVEKHKIIPHHKIEELLRVSAIPYTFIRPGYFMQNLVTTLSKDLQRGEIYLPSGKAKFNWVDTADVGRAIALVLADPAKHRNRAYVITGQEQLAFAEVAQILSRVTGKPMRFKSPSPLAFLIRKKREGVRLSLILVLIALHFLPRFSKVSALSDDFKKLTGRQPGTLEEFIKREIPYL